VRCHDATTSSFFDEVRGEVFAHFHSHHKNVTEICGIDCSACQNEFFMKNPHDVKENEEHALDFTLHLSHPFKSLGEFGLSH
jgi:hypothetical protein